MGTVTPEATFQLLQDGDTILVDLRSPTEFACGHPDGAISVPFSAHHLSERIWTVVPKETPIIFLADHEDQLRSACQQMQEAGAIVKGALEKGLKGWGEAGLPLNSHDELLIGELAHRLADRDGLQVLDVREPMEWETGHVPGAILISLGELSARWQELPTQIPIAIICEVGVRSSTAASFLLTKGFSNVVNVPEGTAAYRQGGYLLQFYDP